MDEAPLRGASSHSREGHLRFRRVVVPIALLFIASVAVRWSWRDDRVVRNIEASYHVLLTVEAMNRTPASTHRFLPIVTLGRDLDRSVPFGASIPGPGGVYYYTSFPPLGFIVPWGLFRATTLAPTIDHLLIFNLGIHFVATLLLALFALEAVNALGVRREAGLSIVLLAAASYLFAREAMYSHGIVYWHHSLFQVVWLLQLVALGRVFRDSAAAQPVRRRDTAALFIGGLLGPAIEWTGYVANAWIAALCWWRARGLPRHPLRRIALGLLLGAAVAGFAFLAHFAWGIGFSPLMESLAGRVEARSGAHGSIGALGAGYVESFGPLLLVTGGIVVTYAIGVRRPLPSWATALMLAAGLPLLANVALSQHAASYHYDRLKGLVFLVISSVILAAMMPPRLRRVALAGWIALLLWNGARLRPTRSVDMYPSITMNASLIDSVHTRTRPCALWATDTYPRAWVTLTFGANTYEAIPTMDSVRHLVAARGACQGVYFVKARDLGDAMYIWRRAMIFDAATGRIDTVHWSIPTH